MYHDDDRPKMSTGEFFAMLGFGVLLICIIAAGANSFLASQPKIKSTGANTTNINIEQSSNFEIKVNQPQQPAARRSVPSYRPANFWDAASAIVLGSVGMLLGFLLILTVCCITIAKVFEQ